MKRIAIAFALALCSIAAQAQTPTFTGFGCNYVSGGGDTSAVPGCYSNWQTTVDNNYPQCATWTASFTYTSTAVWLDNVARCPGIFNGGRYGQLAGFSSYTCPGNSLPATSGCSCGTGSAWNGTQCTVAPPSYPELVSTSILPNVYEFQSSPAGTTTTVKTQFTASSPTETIGVNDSAIFSYTTTPNPPMVQDSSGTVYGSWNAGITTLRNGNDLYSWTGNITGLTSGVTYTVTWTTTSYGTQTGYQLVTRK